MSNEVDREPGDHRRMLARIEHILTDPTLQRAAREDTVATFVKLGLSFAEGTALFDFIVQRFTAEREGQTLGQVEEVIFERFCRTRVDGHTLVERLDATLASRARLIASQLLPHLLAGEGVFDMGTGDGGVCYALRDQGVVIDAAVDVLDYRKPPPPGQNPLPFRRYDGERLPFGDGAFAQSIMTNVAHHAGETADGAGTTKTNAVMLRELCRVTRRRMVVIETIPDPDRIASDGLATAHERTRWNDYLYNRLFHARVNRETVRTDIPVPGRYETAEGWIVRFAALGWKAIAVQHLAYDQASIRDYHILYVFEPAHAGS